MAPRPQPPGRSQRRLRRRRRQRPVLVAPARCRESHRDNLHNLAIARSVSMLRPGGIAAVITSRFSLDSNDRGGGAGWPTRSTWSPRSGCRRAPTVRPAPTSSPTCWSCGAHSRRGPTGAGLAGRHPSRVGRRHPTTVNGYWNLHPDHVLGRIEPGGAIGGRTSTWSATGRRTRRSPRPSPTCTCHGRRSGTHRPSTPPNRSWHAPRSGGRCRRVDRRRRRPRRPGSGATDASTRAP